MALLSDLPFAASSLWVRAFLSEAISILTLVSVTQRKVRICLRSYPSVTFPFLTSDRAHTRMIN